MIILLNSLYTLKIEGKDVKRFLKSLINQKIYFENISVKENKLYLTVDKENMKKIMDVKTSYKISIIKVYGLEKILQKIKYKKIMIICLFFSLVILYILSNMTFKIEIMHSDKEIREIINYELIKHGVKKYSFIKSYDEIYKIKEDILKNNKSKIQWLEIEKIGTKYIIRIDKRVINDKENIENNCNIVAKKSGIIMKINAEKGEVAVKVNDYVKKGDILISGVIHKGEDVKGIISAKGDVYAEVWYKVKAVTPISYKESKKTGNKSNTLNITIFNNNFNLLGNDFKNKITYKNSIINDFFGLFKIDFNKNEEVLVRDYVYDIASTNIAVNEARRKIEENLEKGEYIIYQKKLKTTLNDSTMVTEVFFKVYENIGKKEEIEQIEKGDA